jgi:hypothetical protein
MWIPVFSIYWSVFGSLYTDKILPQSECISAAKGDDFITGYRLGWEIPWRRRVCLM